ncbi:MAG: diaminopimelate epimerase [Pirellulales bacterium]
MGEPILNGPEIPTGWSTNPVVGQELRIADKTLAVTCVSMGNPHCITYVDQLNDDWVLRIGPHVEKHEMFPRRVNAEFVQVLNPNEVTMRVWERGSGETLACGTGASAVCVAGVLTGRTERRSSRICRAET